MVSLRSFVTIVCSTALFAYAQVEFPMGSEVVNVKEDPYNAKGDGKNDDTEAIQKALSDHPDGDYIIYLPHGIYKITSALQWPSANKPDKDYRRTILQGESMGGTIIALQDDVPGFENPDFPQAVIYTGDGPNPRQRNSIRDLTLRTGKKNPGAIGIRFNASVQGTINNVKVTSGDSSGVIGIDVGFTENIGPLLIKNVEVDGFDVGIYAAGKSNSMTFEHVTLSGQKKFGLDNDGQMLSIRALRVKGSSTAVYNHGQDASMVLVDGTLEYDPGKKGAKPITAIVNEGQLFARSVVVSKFKSKIKSTKKAYNESVSNTEIVEFATQQNHQLCHSPKTSMKLAVTETPNNTEQKSMYWTSITGEYGGKANDGSDDSKAIQDAIDDGAETIFFPPGGRWTINRDIYLRNRIHRLIGTEGKIDGKGKFIIEDGAFVDLTIERFSTFASGITNRSKRTLILKNMYLKSYESDDFSTGDIFMEDVAVGTIRTNQQRLWGRQVTMMGDTKGPKISNNGGTIWILGLTAKDGNTILHNFNKGSAELLGVNVIASDKAKNNPMFINDNSSISIIGLKETLTRGNPYSKIVEESRQGSKVYTLKNSELPHNETGGSMMALYTGYAPKQGQNEPPRATITKENILVQPNKLHLVGNVEDDGRGRPRKGHILRFP